MDAEVYKLFVVPPSLNIFFHHIFCFSTYFTSKSFLLGKVDGVRNDAFFLPMGGIVPPSLFFCVFQPFYPILHETARKWGSI